jgi:hypothetical protein
VAGTSIPSSASRASNVDMCVFFLLGIGLLSLQIGD